MANFRPGNHHRYTPHYNHEGPAPPLLSPRAPFAALFPSSSSMLPPTPTVRYLSMAGQSSTAGAYLAFPPIGLFESAFGSPLQAASVPALLYYPMYLPVQVHFSELPARSLHSPPRPPSTSTPLPPCTSTPLSPRISTPLPPRTSTPLSPRISTPLPPRTSTPLPPCPPTPLSPRTSTPLPPRTSTPLLPCPPTPLPVPDSTIAATNIAGSKKRRLPIDKAGQSALCGKDKKDNCDIMKKAPDFIPIVPPKKTSAAKELPQVETKEYKTSLMYRIGFLNCHDTVCPESFANRAQLLRHLRKHHGILEFQCPLMIEDCTHSFEKKEDLWAHMKSAHINKLSWDCYACFRIFDDPKVFEEHLDLEHREGFYECTFKNCRFYDYFLRPVLDHYKHVHNKELFVNDLRYVATYRPPYP